MDWRQATNVGIALAALGLTAGLVVALWMNRFDPVMTNMVLKDFPAIVGLPFAFLGSFIVIALFRQRENALQFKGFGLEFRGAAGEILLWAVCFSVIATSIKLLWRD